MYAKDAKKNLYSKTQTLCGAGRGEDAEKISQCVQPVAVRVRKVSDISKFLDGHSDTRILSGVPIALPLLRFDVKG